MKKNIILITTTLTIGLIFGILIHKQFTKPISNDIARFEEIVKIKELHLIKHTYQDLSFIHRKNDPQKSMKAIAMVPVSVTAFIDLTQMQIQYKNDSLSKIILPRPILSDPNYQIDKMEVKKIKSFQLYLGKDLYSEVLNYLKEIVNRRKEAIIQLSVEDGIVNETQKGAIEYITSILKGLNINDVPIEFVPPTTKAKNTVQTTTKNNDEKGNCFNINDLPIAYLPEFIGVVNLKEEEQGGNMILMNEHTLFFR